MSHFFDEMERTIDIVFCIDGSGSMAHCIDSVKKYVRRFCLEYANWGIEIGWIIIAMRVKLIVFRDYHYDWKQAMIESPFFDLFFEESEFDKFLENILAYGGSVGPKNGLEALYYAMKSDFTTGVKDRHIIVLFTDSDALDLKQCAGETGYPLDMVDEDGLIDIWDCMARDSNFNLRERNKGLLIFAPDDSKYKALKSKLNRSLFIPLNMLDSLEDKDLKDIFKIISLY